MGILDKPQNLKTFVAEMINKFGTKGVWYYEKATIIENINDPTSVGDKIVEYVPLDIAIMSWSVELINDTTILQGDRKGFISEFKYIGTVKPGDYIVKLQDGVVTSRMKIVAPIQPKEYKDTLVALMVNLRA